MYVPPIKSLSVLIDPAIFDLLQHDLGCRGGIGTSWVLMKSLQNYLSQIGEDIKVQFLLPEGFLDAHRTQLYSALLPENRIASLELIGPIFMPFEGCSEAQARLVAVAQQTHAHVLLTEDVVMLGEYTSYKADATVFALGWSKLADLVECFLLGHGIYFSFADCAYGRWLDTYYQTTNGMNGWLLSVHAATAEAVDADARELLRSFAYNRYPFILLARGILQSYRWQALWYRQDGTRDLHAFVKTYYLNSLYLLMWGALDHLCLILNRVHNYGVRERSCGLNKSFREKLKTRHPEIEAFLETDDIARFLMVLSDLRHAAAHRIIPMPAPVVQKTDESEVPDDVLRPQIEAELDEELPALDPATRESFVSFRLHQQRIQKMRRLADSMVFVRKDEGGGYFYDPYISADHDLECLNQVIRKFLFNCFPEALPRYEAERGRLYGI